MKHPIINPRSLSRVAALALVAFANTGAAGCATTVPFDAVGVYAHPVYGYQVATAAVDATGWILENYLLDGGRPTERREGPQYEYVLAADVDDDGEVDTSTWQPNWDLRFRHPRDAGEMWVSTLPISGRLRETDLDVLARRYVEAAAGSVISYAHFAQGVGTTERRFATRVLSETATTVDGFPAVDIVFEVANVDQLQLDATARWERVRLILARPGFEWFPSSRDLERHLPVVVTLGYANHPDDFDRHAADFDVFVRNVSLVEPEIAARADEIFACVPAEVLSFAGTWMSTRAMWTFRAVSPDGDDEDDACLTRALQGYAPRTQSHDDFFRLVRRFEARVDSPDDDLIGLGDESP